MQRVLVAGASGALGRNVVRSLRSRGAFVRVLTRHRERAESLGADEIAVGDATRPETLGKVCSGIDVVFSSLGQSVSVEFNNLRPGYRAVDYAGNHNLLECAGRAKVGRFVYVSVFGADDHLQCAYLRAHADVAQEIRQSGLSYAIVHPTGFFSSYATFFEMARSGRGVLFGSGKALTNPIHDEDLAEVCASAIFMGEEGNISAGGPDTLSRREVFETAFAALEKKPNIVSAPASMPGLISTILMPFAPRLGEMMQFVGLISRIDGVATACGTRRLADYYRDLAQQPSSRRALR